MVGTFASGDPAMWRELLDLNLIGPLATVRYAVHHFGPVGRRDVVLIGSTGAITPSACVGMYAASKRGLRAAFDTLRLELAPDGVNVSLVMPGIFDTEGRCQLGWGSAKLTAPTETPDIPERWVCDRRSATSRVRAVAVSGLLPSGRLALRCRYLRSRL
jgi:NAD(P)-dependent dehydrogenase (short-subunit alcohol dehydrogenase family)